MRLKVIVCSILFLMPAYAFGDDEVGKEPAAVAVEEADGEDYPSAEEETSLPKTHGPVKGEPSNASAQESEQAAPLTNKWFVISGDVGFFSNYIYRGQTQTFGGPAVQGELIISQKKEEGFYAAMWGSNIDSTTAANGSGLELDLYGGYIYKHNPDLSLKLEIRDTLYPGAYNPTITKDSYTMLEVIPGVTYKYFTLIWAYQLSNVSGFNQNFVQTLFTPLNPNGNTKGSWYGEASVNYPIPGTSEKLKLKLLAGYWSIRNYSMLSYAVFGAGLSYTIPECYGGLILSVNGSATTARKKYYTNVNLSGQTKNIVAPVLWAGVMKRF